jgi:hypothetical protein
MCACEIRIASEAPPPPRNCDPMHSPCNRRPTRSLGTADRNPVRGTAATASDRGKKHRTNAMRHSAPERTLCRDKLHRRVLFGNPADPEGPVALRPRIASGLPVRRQCWLLSCDAIMALPSRGVNCICVFVPLCDATVIEKSGPTEMLQHAYRQPSVRRNGAAASALRRCPAPGCQTYAGPALHRRLVDRRSTSEPAAAGTPGPSRTRGGEHARGSLVTRR